MRQYGSHSSNSWIAIAVFLLLAATLASRIPFFDNAIIQKDDQFYLLVGQSILQGDLLYVDVWDRKPAGLFLIYAGIAALGDGNAPYQLVASCFVLMTSLVIARIAFRVSGPRGAILAGLTYILMLPALGGEAGQSPIFYNLLMAGAALLTLDALDRERGCTEWRALGTMLLCGLAMTVKQTTAFEGIAFGLLHLWAMRQQSADWPRIAARGARMMAVAIAPTILIFLVYGLLGHMRELWQATVLSVFAKESIPFSDVEGQVLRQAAVLAVPAIVAIGWLAAQSRLPEHRQRLWFFACWGIAALLGYFSVPNFFDHYALPLAVPLSVMTGAGLAQYRRGLALFALMAAVLCFAYWPRALRSEISGPASQLATDVASRLDGGCLYVFAGPVYLYRSTNACRLSRFVFPDHLESAAEATALPVEPTAEIARVLSAGPAVIVTAPPLFYARNTEVEAIIRPVLACRYDAGHAVFIPGSGRVVPWFRRPAPRAGCEK